MIRAVHAGNVRLRVARGLGTVQAAAMLVTAAVAGAASMERPDDAARAALRAAIERAESFEDRFDAEVWLTDMSGRLADAVEDPRERAAILRLVHQEAHRASLEPELVLSVIHVESNFDRFAISSAGARGLMQVMPFWLHEIGRPDDNLFHVATNLRFGCTILRHYLDVEQGNLERALARYNGSLGKNWYPRRVFRAWRQRWFPQ